LSPSGPTPKTATVSPARTCARLVTAPDPCSTAHDSSDAAVAGDDLLGQYQVGLKQSLCGMSHSDTR